MRRYGLACDNLLGASVALSDGRLVRATAVENPELFWALRGGAGGFGVVTSFDFALHPLLEVVAGLIIHPLDRAAALLRIFREIAASAPDEYCSLVVLTSAPPLPFLDPAWHGRPVAIHAHCWCGAVAAADEVLAPIRQLPAPLAEHVGPMPYAQWQRMQDPGAPAGRYNYWKTSNFATLTDATLDTLVAAAERLPTPQTELHIQHMGGAVARAPRADSAFAQRDATFFVNLIGVAAERDALLETGAGMRDLYARLAPHALPGILPNFADRDDGDAVTGSQGAQAERIEALRRRYDQSRLFARE
jgi:FAD/FMN-containing dehydrogenase